MSPEQIQLLINLMVACWKHDEPAAEDILLNLIAISEGAQLAADIARAHGVELPKGLRLS